MNNDPKQSSTKAQTLAIVSGKGGSGKTLIATAIAMGIASQGKKVLLVDTDFGTGGLTYYLGFSAFVQARQGLAEFMATPTRKGRPESYNLSSHVARASEQLQYSAKEFTNIDLFPVGEHQIFDHRFPAIYVRKLSYLINFFLPKYDYIVFDCRGGLDDDSLSVCKAVDRAVLVAETDAASIQATKHLADSLHGEGLGRKLTGFILNKVMDDPSALAVAGLTFFRCEHLASIPLDIETTRHFIKGESPDVNSIFCRHAFRSLAKIFGEFSAYSKIRTLQTEAYTELTTRSPYSKYAGILISAVAIYAIGTVLFMKYVLKSPNLSEYYEPTLLATSIALIASQSEVFKETFGYITQKYFETINSSIASVVKALVR
jgi:flagellar biosynthesis protein FlhG